MTALTDLLVDGKHFHMDHVQEMGYTKKTFTKACFDAGFDALYNGKSQTFTVKKR